MAKQTIFAYLGINTDDFQKGMGKAKTQMSGFEKAGASFAKNIGGIFAGAFAIESIISFGKEASEMAGKLTGIEAAFKRIDNGGLLNNLRAATKGTVSDLQLMQSAVQAENLGLPIQQLGTYFEFARRTAKATGESVDFLVDSIVKGIGRKSPLILDNLGISTTQLNEQLKKTPDFATAVGIVIEEKMGKAGEDIDTAAESTAQLAASWDNAKVKIGGLINAGLVPLQGSLGSIVEGYDGVFESGQSVEQFTANFLKTQSGLNVAVKTFDEQLGELISTFNRLTTEQLKSEKGLRAFATSMIAMGLTTEEAVKKYKQLIDSKKGLGDTTTQVRTIALIEQEISMQNELLKGASDRSGAMAIQERIGKLEKEKQGILGVAKAHKDLAKLNKAKEGLDFSVNTISTKGLQLKESELPTFAIQEGIEALPSLFDKAMATLEMRVKRTQSAMQSSADAINAAFANIAVEGLATLGAALGTAFAGGDVMQIGMQFAATIADAIGNLGKNLIEIGIVMTGIMEALKTGGFANPALLIGGGIALVALSGAMKGMMSNSVGFADGGLVTGSVFANIGEGIGTNSANPEVIAPLDKLKNFINPSQGSGMSGGDVKFRIEGNTLVGILDRQSKNTKYSR